MTTTPKTESVQSARPARTAVAVSKKTIADKIGGQDFKLALANVLPKHLSPDRIVRVAIQAITRTPDLAKCDPPSFYSSLLKLSALGLEPDGYQAHLIPFWNSKRSTYECQLIVDYKGLVEVAMRTGMFSQPPIAQVVRWNDDFVWNKGVVERHIVDWRSERGPVYAVYIIVKTKTGGEISNVMSKDAIEAIRQRSKSPDKGPWATDWEEMAKKTVFRQLSKWLPRSPEFRDSLEADVDAAEERRFDVSRPIFDATPTKALFDSQGEEGGDGDLGPQRTAQETGTGAPAGQSEVQQEAHGSPAAVAETSEDKTRRQLKALNFLMKSAQHTEAEVLDFLRQNNRIDESLSSLKEVAEMKPSALEWAHDQWASLDNELKRKAGKK